jgi:hypothetical protein
MASTSARSTVEWGAFGPIGASWMKARFFNSPVVAPGELFDRSLRSLYRSSDDVRGLALPEFQDTPGLHT